MKTLTPLTLPTEMNHLTRTETTKTTTVTMMTMTIEMTANTQV